MHMSDVVLEQARQQRIRNTSRAASVFAGLANNVRLAAVLKLMEREWSVNEMAMELGLSQSALSQHLSKLRHAGIVSRRRDGATIYYHCMNPKVAEILRTMSVID